MCNSVSSFAYDNSIIKTTLNNDDIVYYMLCGTRARETSAIWSDLLSTQIVMVSMELHLDLSMVRMFKKNVKYCKFCIKLHTKSIKGYKINTTKTT